VIFVLTRCGTRCQTRISSPILCCVQINHFRSIPHRVVSVGLVGFRQGTVESLRLIRVQCSEPSPKVISGDLSRVTIPPLGYIDAEFQIVVLEPYHAKILRDRATSYVVLLVRSWVTTFGLVC
jgi:hypothetical protein